MAIGRMSSKSLTRGNANGFCRIRFSDEGNGAKGDATVSFSVLRASQATEDSRHRSLTGQMQLPHVRDARRKPTAVSSPSPNQWHHASESTPAMPLKRKAKSKRLKHPEPLGDASRYTLSLMDERVLVLYHSALKRAWVGCASLAIETSNKIYGHEAEYAATQIQRIARGVSTRERMRAITGPRFQRAARRIQFAYRRLQVNQRVQMREQAQHNRTATRMQAWYRGCRCRDHLREDQARWLNNRIAQFQRRYRGYRFWRVVSAILHQRRELAVTELQRAYRGCMGRRRAKARQFELMKFERHLRQQMDVHRQFVRCQGCNLDQCSLESLFDCMMVRYIGLHDFHGATMLCQDGIRLFPLSAKFYFFYGVLLQVMGHDVEIAKAFIDKAMRALQINDEELTQCEKQYLLPALHLRPQDAAIQLDFAVFCQSSGKVNRAEANYAKAIAQFPPDYVVPGYLHRLQMLDRLLLNYHRFYSLFQGRGSNILVSTIPIAKRGEKIRLMVAKWNHFTVISAADEADASRFNSVYLSDDEVFAIFSEWDKANAGASQAGNTTGNPPATDFRNLTAWRTKSSSKSILHQRSNKQLSKVLTTAKKPRISLPLIYQREFRGLNLRPREIALFSEAKSRLIVSREQAERLLKELVFVDPSTTSLESGRLMPSRMTGSAQSTAFLHRVVVVPFVLKCRQQHALSVSSSFAAVDIQRVFRGFRFRFGVRRTRLLQQIQQTQIDHMLARLQANHTFRQHRRESAIEIQRIYKGFMLRNKMHRWHEAALQIQRAFRGYRGRKRVIAFREGNCTFYMAERVFQRGIEIDGRRILLVIEKCGLSFRFDGFDLDSCSTYQGFFSRQSSLGLICYLNWTRAESFCGREFTVHAQKLRVVSVASINGETGECFVLCRSTDLENNSPGTTEALVSLVDCVNAINLRAAAAKDCEEPVLLLPVTVDDTARLVSAMTERMTLTQALPMPVKDQNRSALQIIAVQAPPGMHFVFRKQAKLDKPMKLAGNPAADIAIKPAAMITKFPLTEGLRGVTIGKKYFRKPCQRHAREYTRCRCVLPIVSTAAHVEAISLALVSLQSGHEFIGS